MNLEEESIKQLVDAMNNDSLIIFAGAGISVDSNLPNWNQLMETFKEDLSLTNSNESNLKIAQYYYDTWGKQKYFNKLIEIFGKSNVGPNPIHEQIKKIHPDQVITTNYDSLLEDELNSDMDKYDVIRQDDDIPYAESGHYLIKMHGDFKNKNIVLKENDYLDYHKNFYMVSTLIKALIMSKTILFIGYSLNDSTFNSIFRMIQNSFGDDAKKAYFYTVNSPETPIIEYYKKKGMYVLSDGKNIDSKKFGEKTVEFLTKISRNKDLIATNQDELWERLKFFDKLSFVESEFIAEYSTLRGKAFLYSPDIFRWGYNNDQTFSISKDNKITNFIENKTWLTEFLGFESKKHGNSESIFKVAFDLYKNGDYELAKEKFHELSNLSYKRHNYSDFLIAEFNMLHIDSIFFNDKTHIKTYKYDDFSRVVDRIIKSANFIIKLATLEK